MVEYRAVVRDSDYRVGDDGSAWSKKSGEWVRLSGTPDRDGYPTIGIGGKRFAIHVLVLEAFRGPRPPKMKGRHLNDIKTDNRLENLAWGTSRQNHDDAVANGRIVPKLDAVKAREAVVLHRAGKTQKAIGELLGVCTLTVHRILSGKLWAGATGITPRKKDDFEGRGRATRIQLLASWEWVPKEICDFLEVSAAEVRNVLNGKSWGSVTGIEEQKGRSQVINELTPEILKLRAEGWLPRQIAQHLGVAENTVHNVAKGRRRQASAAQGSGLHR